MTQNSDRELRSSKIPDFAPGQWDEGQALRECALLTYPESHVRILREIFPALGTIYGEEGVRELSYCGSFTKGQLRAVMQDLKYTARFLAMTARESADAESDSDWQLGELADRLAVHIENLANLIENRIVPKRKRKAVECEA